jgi:hypothetical protein
LLGDVEGVFDELRAPRVASTERLRSSKVWNYVPASRALPGSTLTGRLNERRRGWKKAVFAAQPQSCVLSEGIPPSKAVYLLFYLRRRNDLLAAVFGIVQEKRRSVLAANWRIDMSRSCANAGGLITRPVIAIVPFLSEAVEPLISRQDAPAGKCPTAPDSPMW